jgi:hypothetical protein
MRVNDVRQESLYDTSDMGNGPEINSPTARNLFDR